MVTPMPHGVDQVESFATHLAHELRQSALVPLQKLGRMWNWRRAQSSACRRDEDPVGGVSAYDSNAEGISDRRDLLPSRGPFIIESEKALPLQEDQYLQEARYVDFVLRRPENRSRKRCNPAYFDNPVQFAQSFYEGITQRSVMERSGG